MQSHIVTKLFDISLIYKELQFHVEQYLNNDKIKYIDFYLIFVQEFKEPREPTILIISRNLIRN